MLTRASAVCYAYNIEDIRMKVVSAPVAASTLSESNIKAEYEHDLNLWSSVIELAMLDLQKGRGRSCYDDSHSYSGHQKRKDSLEFFFGNGKHHFEDICSLLEIDPDYFRGKIMDTGLIEPTEIGMGWDF